MESVAGLLGGPGAQLDDPSSNELKGNETRLNRTGPSTNAGRAAVRFEAAMDELATFPCPRCNREVNERFWGPCGSCRSQLVASVRGEAHDLETAKFEPAMNVTPNFVATKD